MESYLRLFPQPDIEEFILFIRAIDAIYVDHHNKQMQQKLKSKSKVK